MTDRYWVIETTEERMTIEESLKKFKTECRIKYDHEVISDHPLLDQYADFLIDFYAKENRAVSFTSHTGSILFDAMALTYGLVRALCATGSADVRGQLAISGYRQCAYPVPEESVVYVLREGALYPVHIERFDSSGFGTDQLAGCVYRGKCRSGGNRSQRIQTAYFKADEAFYEPPKAISFEKCKPISLLKLGAARGKCSGFFKDLLGYEAPPSSFNSRLVACMANSIAAAISICYDNKEFKLSELQPDNSKVLFCEPSLKQITLGGDLIHKNKLKRLSWCGFILGSVQGAHVDSASVTTFVKERLSLKSVLFNAPGPADGIVPLAKAGGIRGFVCSHDRLQRHNLAIPGRRREMSARCLLDVQISTMANRTIKYVIVPDPADVSLMTQVRSCLCSLSRQEGENEAVRRFLGISYALLRLFNTSPVPLSKVQDSPNRGLSVSQRMADLRQCLDVMTGSRKSAAQSAAEILAEIYDRCKDSDDITRAIIGLECRNQTIRTVVAIPNNFIGLSSVFSNLFYSGYALKHRNMLSFVPRGQLQRLATVGEYDALVVVGGTGYYDLQAFDYLSSPIARDVYVILHQSEVPGFLKAAKERQEVLAEMGRMSHDASEQPVVHTYLDDLVGDQGLAQYSTPRVESGGIVAPPEDILSNLLDIERRIYMPPNDLGEGMESDSMRQCCAHMVFEGEGEAFLTDGYRALRIREQPSGELDISEREKVGNVSIGDMLVFPVNVNRRLDALDEMISHWIENEVPEAKRKDCRLIQSRAVAWKEALWRFRDDNRMKDRDVARRLAQVRGCPVQEAAIMNWLDPDSHIVRPEKVEAIRAIGELVKDSSMINDPHQFESSWSQIYALRQQMRGRLQQMLCDSLKSSEGGTNGTSDGLLESIVRIVRVSFIDGSTRAVPYQRVNRLLSF